jgi:hypothetical protein
MPQLFLEKVVVLVLVATLVTAVATVAVKVNMAAAELEAIPEPVAGQPKMELVAVEPVAVIIVLLMVELQVAVLAHLVRELQEHR